MILCSDSFSLSLQLRVSSLEWLRSCGKMVKIVEAIFCFDLFIDDTWSSTAQSIQHGMSLKCNKLC